MNLKKGKDVFLELVRKADILIENYRPGTMEKLGIGYEELKKVNPKLVYGCISGFGHYGPYSKRPGYDIVGQAMSGIMSVTGWPDGEATRAGAPVSDTVAGISWRQESWPRSTTHRRRAGARRWILHWWTAW